MDGDERRSSKRRSLEAAREIFARYKASQGRMDNQTDPSDGEELGHNETIDTQNSSMMEDASCRDTTQSSMSVSEGEGEADIENIAGRVAELKELLQGKEAVIESLSAEIDHMRAEACSPNSSQSQNSTQYRDLLLTYQTKLQDFEVAVHQRDGLITELTESLEQALAARDEFKERLQSLTSLPIFNQPPESSNQQQALQETVQQLTERLQAHEAEKTQIITLYKTQIGELNQRIEALTLEHDQNLEERQKVKTAYDAQVEKIRRDMEGIIDNFATETNINAAKHQQELNKMIENHEEAMKSMRNDYDNQIQTLQDRANKELVEIGTKHAKELSVFQTQLSTAKKTIDSLKSQIASQPDKNELTALKNQVINAHHERELLVEQIKLHKVQVDELTAKCLAAASVFDSKESIEKSLEEALGNVAQLKQENETLKFKYDDLSARYSAAQALIENNQAHERSMSSRIYELERSVGRMSGINNSLFSEFNETTYQTFDDMALQVQLSKQKLEEKEELEKQLIERIRSLEESVSKANSEIEKVSFEKKSFEKEVKDLKNNCDKIMSEHQAMESERINFLEKQVDELREKVKGKETEFKEKYQKLLEKNNQLQVDCKQLVNGLQMAWDQCAEREQKLNESLLVNESRFGDSIGGMGLSYSLMKNTLVDDDGGMNCSEANEAIASSLVDGINATFNRYDIILQEYVQLAADNNRLKDDVESLKLSVDEVEKEKSGLTEEIERLREKHEEEIGLMKKMHLDEVETMKKLFEDNGFEKFKEDIEKKHAEEMEELRMYFEEKVLHVEKQYSEEIFSQSKKLSDDSSEVEDMTDDLYFGGAGDAQRIRVDVKENLKEKNSYRESRLVPTNHQHCQTELDVTLENGELSELRAAYSMQLEEQIALARRDIVNALQEQIQALLAVEDDTEDNWPPELLQLRNKFTSNSKREIEKLKETHQLELSKLKDEYTKTIDNYETELKRLNQLTQCRLSNQLDLHLPISEELVKQKCENLYKMTLILKGLLVDLIKYIVTCEEELNNTFITEIIKRQVISDTQNSSVDDVIEDKDDDEKNVTSPRKKIIKRVHFAPHSREISSIINSDSESLLDLIDEEENISAKLRGELNRCLERLRTESAEIISVSATPGDGMLDTLSKQVLWTTKVNEELSAKLSEAEGIIEDYQMESQQMKIKIIDLQQKISIIEGTKEIISEGYGEQDENGGEVVVQDISQLLDKARLAIVNATGDTAYHLQLIEELCRCTEKILDDSKREREDLQQQIDAADKQLRSTRKFLEEQASEREIERDEAAKHIESLQEQLKERERDKERDLRITSESPSPIPDSSLGTSKLQLDYKATVEALEFQMREMTSQITDTEAKKSAAESELKAAVEKIWMLRDIIMELEQQLQSKTSQEDIHLTQITNLKDVISAQTRNQQELAEELSQLKSGAENSHLNAHITHLQDELQKHKLSTEHFNVNSSALKQMRAELREMQGHLDKRIKELEALHMCGSTLSISQPSEDVSIRDQIDASRCQSPDEEPDPPTLPLDQLLKLKEKLLKHSRTEEVAFKKIKDLDMQLTALKNQNEELQEERDLLQQTTSDQLFQIEQMRGRLEQYKQSAPFAQRQATSRLELELHEINTRVQTLERTIADKDLELCEMRTQLERANLLLKETQEELATAVNTEDNVIQELRDKLEMLEHEKKVLESKVSHQERAQQEIPQLIDSMLADKNDEIDHLKDQLSKKEKQLEAINSLNDDNKAEPKNSARTLSDIVSINSECEEMPEAIREGSNVNLIQNISSFRRPDQEQKSELVVPLLDLGISPNTTPIHERHGSMMVDSMMSGLDLKSPSVSAKSSDDASKPSPTAPKSQKAIQDLELKLKEIYEELKSKSSTLNKREIELNELKKSLDELRAESKDSIDTLTRDKDFYKSQYELSQESEKKIRRDLDEVENYLKIKNEELDLYREKIQVNEKLLIEITTDNTKLKEEVSKLKETTSNYEIKLREKIEELNNLRKIIFEKDITIETIQTRNIEIEDENKKLYDYKTKFELLRKDLMDNQNEMKRLTDGINSRDVLIQRLEEMARRTSFSSPEDMHKDQEIYHLKELVKEKDKIIQQMTDDSKSLHRELETVHRKMKEPGNVVELRKKLQQEKKCNGELVKMVTKLSKELEALKEDSLHHPEVNDLEDMVQRELNLSADLDRKIMDAIESENDEISMRKIEMHSCNSLTIKPVEQDLEKIMEQYMDLRSNLKRQNKLNDELNHQKNELEIEREMLKSQVCEYETRILQLKSDYEMECKRVNDLTDELVVKKSAIRNLEVQIKKEKSAHNNSQLEDSNLIEMLRIKLTAAVGTETQLRENNHNLREKNKLLTSQLTALKYQIESQRVGVIGHTTRLEIPPDNELNNDKYEKLFSENVQLKSTNETLESEKNKYKRDLELANEENENLLSKLAIVEGDKEHLDITMKRLTETIKMREDECDWLKKKIKTMSDADDKRRQKKYENENELKSLRQEIKNVREVMNDWQIDTDQMRQQLSSSLAERAQLSEIVLTLRKKEEELNKKLIESKNEVERLNEVISDLRGQLKIEKVLHNKDNVDGGFLGELNDKLERYAAEKSILHDKLMQERQEKAKYIERMRELEVVNMQKQFDDREMSDKFQQLYGKYIRADSKRKALSFQKRYLLCVIGGYQLSEENTLCVLAQLTNTERHYANYENKKRAKLRLRSVVLVVISVMRMKWLVKRWRSGARKAGGSVFVEPEKSFVGIQRGLEHSPPVREKRTHNGGNINYEHYLERISCIQENLGLAVSQVEKGE